MVLIILLLLLFSLDLIGFSYLKKIIRLLKFIKIKKIKIY